MGKAHISHRRCRCITYIAFFFVVIMTDIDVDMAFWFVDLGALTNGKIFPGLAVGSFVDMRGQTVEFDISILAEIASNTNNIIGQMQARNIPGLPVDTRKHEKGEAAGWITGATLGKIVDSAGTVLDAIYLTAEWTVLGVQLIGDRIMTNFSPTVDLISKTIRGGSLTNWPASVDNAGIPLFPAVELCAGVHICTPATDKAIYMKTTHEELEEVGGAITAAPLTQIPTSPASLSAPLNMLELSANMRQQIADLITESNRQAVAQFKVEMQQEKQRAELMQFAEFATMGTAEHPRGLPVPAGRLAAFLCNLSLAQAKEAQAIFEIIWHHGVSEFSVTGYSGQVQHKQTLHPLVKAQLDAWVEAGNSVPEFFKANAAELGEMTLYELENHNG